MVDTEGSVDIASARQDGQRGEQKVVEQLKRYKVKVEDLQEIKWFGSEMYKVAGAVVLTSGRVRPSAVEHFQREEKGWQLCFLTGL